MPWGPVVVTSPLRSEPVNELYKKGCQEKSSASTGGSKLFLEIQPTLFRTLKMFGLLSHPRKFSLCAMVAKFEYERRGKQDDVHHGSMRGSGDIALSCSTRGD